MGEGPAVTVRRARADDQAAVSEFTSDTWPDREATDYLPRVFAEWVASDGPDQRTLVATVDGEPVGCCQGVLLSDREAWAQGLRVAPAHRGAGIASQLAEAVLAWATDRGATVCRTLVFSWNTAGLATARRVGFSPVAEFRWAHPEPDAERAGPAELTVTERPEAVWRYWQGSDARGTLSGLVLDPDESWALSELTRETLRDLAASQRVLAVQDDAEARGIAVRTRASDHPRTDDHWAEYGVAGWETVPAAEALFAAIARDAADLGADRTRVLVPETPRHVSDAAAVGVPVAGEPDVVLEATLPVE